jgi:hypothetical protein
MDEQSSPPDWGTTVSGSVLEPTQTFIQRTLGKGPFEEKRLEHKADNFLNLGLRSIKHEVLPPRQSYTFMV